MNGALARLTPSNAGVAPPPPASTQPAPSNSMIRASMRLGSRDANHQSIITSAPTSALIVASTFTSTLPSTSTPRKLSPPLVPLAATSALKTNPGSPPQTANTCRITQSATQFRQGDEEDQKERSLVEEVRQCLYPVRWTIVRFRAVLGVNAHAERHTLGQSITCNKPKAEKEPKAGK
ncbi:hypothetical protein BDZ45DRAFT_675977 [Acephala macrosclerotiorum]|nr:hypothetical protein BDZ45DRAFT_675977 [Acephala macrosclerotiorum]